MERLLFLVALLFATKALAFSPEVSDHFSLGIGMLVKEGNPFLQEDIVIFEVSDGIKLTKLFSGNIQFLVSFPDERYSFLRFRTYGYINLYEIKWLISPSLNLSLGFENTSHFVKHHKDVTSTITNWFVFEYYGIFMPYFTLDLKASIDIVKTIFLGVGWFGGMPILFIPNRKPDWGLLVGYPFYYLGIREVLLDEIVFYYDTDFRFLSFSIKF
ncbi:MAG: hypothetical protein ABDH28_06890 [Brevinematia bacterium]